MSPSHLEDSYFWVIQWFLSPHGLLPFFFNLVENFIYNVVLVFAVQQCESAMSIHQACYVLSNESLRQQSTGIMVTNMYGAITVLVSDSACSLHALRVSRGRYY